MLLGFKRQFAPYVLDGSKTHTIRAIRKGNYHFERLNSLVDAVAGKRITYKQVTA